MPLLYEWTVMNTFYVLEYQVVIMKRDANGRAEKNPIKLVSLKTSGVC